MKGWQLGAVTEEWHKPIGVVIVQVLDCLPQCFLVWILEHPDLVHVQFPEALICRVCHLCIADLAQPRGTGVLLDFLSVADKLALLVIVEG